MNFLKIHHNLNSISKLVITFLLSVSLSFIQTQPVLAKSDSKGDSDQPDIVLVRRHSNWAWGYSDYGIFIDEEGNIYSFNFGDSVEGGYPDMEDVPSDGELLEILGELQETTKPTDKANKLIVFICDILAEGVDVNAELTSEHTACDAGQDTLYVVNNSGQLIEISSYGDNTKHRECPVAKIIDKLYNTFIEDITF
ncbi:MAG: hypothetical protein E7258_05435 [Lachnospiraceae bacterium]|nr:hypothetical protein [Lachnospiraceae bacterium]